ncbi:MAG: hypothetical protein L0K79_06405, partial [Lacticaseibacillus paracasei]|nr:hypothetical protein [Lacticaseibacillus paracasei]
MVTVSWPASVSYRRISMLKKTMSGHGASTQEKTAALTRYSQMSDQAVYQALKTNPDGLSSNEAAD